MGAKIMPKVGKAQSPYSETEVGVFHTTRNACLRRRLALPPRCLLEGAFQRNVWTDARLFGLGTAGHTDLVLGALQAAPVWRSALRN